MMRRYSDIGKHSIVNRGPWGYLNLIKLAGPGNEYEAASGWR